MALAIALQFPQILVPVWQSRFHQSEECLLIIAQTLIGIPATWFSTSRAFHFEWGINCSRLQDLLFGTSSAIRSIFFRTLPAQDYWPIDGSFQRFRSGKRKVLTVGSHERYESPPHAPKGHPWSSMISALVRAIFSVKLTS